MSGITSGFARAGAKMLNTGSDLLKYSDTRFDEFGAISYQG
jgi:hypothetical protein